MTCESCIHYKFGNITDYSTIKFHGLELSLYDLKMKILQAKRMNVSPLQIINAQNKKAFVHDSEMIPRNTSVIVKRLPVSHSNYSSKNSLSIQKVKTDKEFSIQDKSILHIGDESDLTKIDLPEDSVIEEMMIQANNVLGKKNVENKYPTAFRCFRCDQIGHNKDRCPLFLKSKAYDLQKKRPKGIPSTMLEIVPKETLEKNSAHQGIYMDRRGDYVIPIVDKIAMAKKSTATTNQDIPSQKTKDFIPNDMKCKLCLGIFRDAVVIQCCGNSFCDECIRNSLLENNFHCPLPECNKSEILPDHLVPNQQLRKTVKRYLANIVDEKYSSNPICSTSDSVCSSDSKQKSNFAGDNCSKINPDSQSINFSHSENEKNPDTTPMPLPILFNSHNIFISSVQYNSDVQTADVPFKDSNSFTTKTENRNIDATTSKQEPIDNCVSENLPYPLLSRSEFYEQQSRFRKRYFSKEKLIPNADFATKDSLQNNKLRKPLLQEQHTINAKEINLKTQNSSINQRYNSNDEIFNDALCSLRGEEYQFEDSKTFNLDPNFNITSENLKSQRSSNKKIPSSITCDIKEIVPGNIPTLPNPIQVNNLPIWQYSIADNTASSKTVTNSDVMDVSEGEIFDEMKDSTGPGIIDDKKKINIKNSDIYNSFNRSRLQSTVKKISHDHTLGENYGNAMSRENKSSNFILQRLNQPSESKEFTNDDSASSEIEEGQIVGNRSLNQPIFDEDREIVGKNFVTFPQGNDDIVCKTRNKDALLDQRFKLKFVKNIKSHCPTPERIVMIKSSRKSEPYPRLNNAFNQNCDHSITSSRQLNRISYISPRKRRSHLLMTRTKDKRIVEIKTRKNRTNSRNEIGLLGKFPNRRNL